MAPNQASVFAENEGLKQALGAARQGSKQRASVFFLMWLEGLEVVTESANAGDPGAKRICREIADRLDHARALASGIVVAK